MIKRDDIAVQELNDFASVIIIPSIRMLDMTLSMTLQKFRACIRVIATRRLGMTAAKSNIVRLQELKGNVRVFARVRPSDEKSIIMIDPEVCPQYSIQNYRYKSNSAHLQVGIDCSEYVCIFACLSPTE